MGRKRVDPEEKRIRLTITLPKKLVDILKEKDINISRLIEQLLKNYLKR